MNNASWLLYPGLFVASLVGAAAGAFFKRIGEDFAAQQSIQKLTATVENIKAAISDDVWDRQRQWEMRRDAVYDAWRALHELHTSLFNILSVFSHPIPNYGNDEDLKNSLLSTRSQAADQFDACKTTYYHANNLARLVMGNEFPKLFCAYAKQAEQIANEIMNGNTGSFTPERSKELAEKINDILQGARKELNIKNADCVEV